MTLSFKFLFPLFFLVSFTAFPGGSHPETSNFPPTLESYQDSHLTSVFDIFSHRVEAEPFNLIAALIFFLAILHTFMASKFLHYAHHRVVIHNKKIEEKKVKKGSVDFLAGIFHFLGEVEVVFGIWVLALIGAITFFFDWHTAVNYVAHKVNYTEALFVIAIMTLSSTRPILKLSETMMWRIANLFGGTLRAWWATILIVGPLLGSFITEPAAMTISALLLSRKFFSLNPNGSFRYATLGLLFVNISVGGTLTHFAAPPVLMVAAPWEWDMPFMMMNFGWKATVGICISTFLYFYFYRDQFAALQKKYTVICLENELRDRYMKREDLEREFEDLETVLDKELGFNQAFDKKCEDIKARLRNQITRKISGQDLDLEKDEDIETFNIAFEKQFKGIEIDEIMDGAAGLFEWAFEKRFDEIKVNEMQKTLPGLLPRGRRVRFQDPNWNNREDGVPVWVMIAHLVFMAWIVFNAHYPALFIGGLLFFLGFAQVTSPYQNRVDLKSPLLVGFFLAGLVTHGGVQAWWIAPVLGSLEEVPLMLGAIVLTAFNDNAAITYLSTLVPNFTAGLKYAVVAGAVTGGGLTVIANAPNPAGVSILKGHFPQGVSPLGLLKAALPPTIVMALCFLLL